MLIVGIISMILFSGPDRPETSSRVHGNVHESQVYFRWDKSNYEDNYQSNAQAANKVYNLIKEIGTERVDSVIVKAYASPEGAYGHNMDLSRRRAMECHWTSRHCRRGGIRQRLPLQHPGDFLPRQPYRPQPDQLVRGDAFQP